MFTELQSQVWSVSDASVVASVFTEESIDGSCEKIVWTSGINQYAQLAFTSVDLSLWEEITLQLYMQDSLISGDVFKISIDGTDYTFTRDNLRRRHWNHVLFNCQEMGTISTIRITSLVDDLMLFVDVVGVRKVTDTCDIDVVNALKAAIELDYDVETTLSAAVIGGDESITLASSAYISDSTLLQIDTDPNDEIVELANKSGSLIDPITIPHASGATVTALCPVRGEDYDSVSPDPVCGIKLYDVGVDKDLTTAPAFNGVKIKEYLGQVGILIYLDCSFKKKLLQLVRQFNRDYGKEFQILLDGELVDVYLEGSVFTDKIIGNNPRMAYMYRIEPQPYLVWNNNELTMDLTLDSRPVTDLDGLWWTDV